MMTQQTPGALVREIRQYLGANVHLGGAESSMLDDAALDLARLVLGEARQPTMCVEPAKVPSDSDLQAFWDEACKDSPQNPGWCRHLRYGRALLASYGRAAQSGPCLTCGGSGWVGGPSFYDPGEGGEPCPDCAPQPVNGADELLSAICDAFHIGSAVRTHETVMANVENAIRRSRCLGVIEQYLTVETPPDPDEGDGEPGEECLLRWGAEPDTYAKHFAEALAQFQAAQPQPSGNPGELPTGAAAPDWLRDAILEEAAQACERRELRASRTDMQAVCRLCASDIRALKSRAEGGAPDA